MLDYSVGRPLNSLRVEPATFNIEGRYCVCGVARRYRFKITV